MSIESTIFDLTRQNRQFVVATVVKTSGSTPGKIGFKLLYLSDGTTEGTVGGGAIEIRAIKECAERLATGKSELKDYLLSANSLTSEEEVEIVPMSCSGKISIFYEVHGQLPTAYIFGGGHVGHALLYHLSPLDYHSILIDNREEFANNQKNPLASEIVFSDYINYSNSVKPSPNSYAVILTHGHTFDYDIAKILLERKLEFCYIGIIASRSKANGIIKKLKTELGDEIDLSKLHTPVGLSIGGSSASEIGLSIAAQMQAVRYRKQDQER